MTYFTKKEYALVLLGGIMGLCAAGFAKSPQSLFDLMFWGYIAIVAYFFAASLHNCNHPDIQGDLV